MRAGFPQFFGEYSFCPAVSFASAKQVQHATILPNASHRSHYSRRVSHLNRRAFIPNRRIIRAAVAVGEHATGDGNNSFL
jgi:hypothetical protein